MQGFHKLTRANDRRHSPQRVTLWCFAIIVILANLAVACQRHIEPDGVTRQDLRLSQNILHDFMLTQLRLDPMAALTLGLDTELSEATHHTFGDVSQAGLERRRLIHLELLLRLGQRPRLPAQRQLAQDLEIAAIQLARLIALEQTGRADASTGHADIYSIHPFSNPWRQLPGVLTHYHAIDTVDDARAYLVRMAALADAVEDIKRRLRADALTGRGPPQRLIQETLIHLEQLIADPQHELHMITEVFESLLESVPDLSPHLSDEMRIQSIDIFNTHILPAYRNLYAELQSQAYTAPRQTGLWAQPMGAQLYQHLRTFYDAGTIPPDRLHSLSSRTVLQAQERLRTRLLSAQTVSEPATQIADSAPETSALLRRAYADSRASHSPSAPAQTPGQNSASLAKRDILLSRLTPHTLFAASPDILDLDWPEDLQNRLRQLASEPAFPDATIGHPARKLTPFAPLARALTLYQRERSDTGTPDTGTIATHHVLLLEAVLATADTGLHHKRWRFDEACDYIEAAAFVDRQIAEQAGLWLVTYPGLEAAKFELWQQLTRLSSRAGAVLQDAYDEAAFQSVIRDGGPRPFIMVETEIEAWYDTLLEE